MREPRRPLAILLVAAAAVLPACGGGSSGGGAVPTGGCLSFAAAQAPAAGRVVARSQAGGTCTAQTVEVVLTDVDDVFGAAFVASFDSAVLDFLSASAAGSLLASGGTQVSVQASDQGASVTVGVSRLGASTGVDVSGSAVLVRLTFAPRRAGTSPLTFSQTQVFGSETPPQPKSGLTWSGGTFRVL